MSQRRYKRTYLGTNVRSATQCSAAAQFVVSQPPSVLARLLVTLLLVRFEHRFSLKSGKSSVAFFKAAEKRRAACGVREREGKRGANSKKARWAPPEQRVLQSQTYRDSNLALSSSARRSFTTLTVMTSQNVAYEMRGKQSNCEQDSHEM